MRRHDRAVSPSARQYCSVQRAGRGARRSTNDEAWPLTAQANGNVNMDALVIGFFRSTIGKKSDTIFRRNTVGCVLFNSLYRFLLSIDDYGKDKA
jgi:hypothetical protein